MPRIIDAEYAECPKGKPCPDPMSKKEIEALWAFLKDTGNRRGMLFVLLGLNCGWRSTDVSTLTADMLKEENGRTYIRRQRANTGADGNSLLWKATAQLLREHIAENPSSDPDGRVILTKAGKPLVVHSFAHGKSDQLGEHFKRIVKAIGWKANHSRLRDSGATWMREHAPAEVSNYLSHTRKDMSKHYADENYNSLFAASDRMGEYFGFAL